MTSEQRNKWMEEVRERLATNLKFQPTSDDLEIALREIEELERLEKTWDESLLLLGQNVNRLEKALERAKDGFRRAAVACGKFTADNWAYRELTEISRLEGEGK